MAIEANNLSGTQLETYYGMAITPPSVVDLTSIVSRLKLLFDPPRRQGLSLGLGDTIWPGRSRLLASFDAPSHTRIIFDRKGRGIGAVIHEEFHAYFSEQSPVMRKFLKNEDIGQEMLRAAAFLNEGAAVWVQNDLIFRLNNVLNPDTREQMHQQRIIENAAKAPPMYLLGYLFVSKEMRRLRAEGFSPKEAIDLLIQGQPTRIDVMIYPDEYTQYISQLTTTTQSRVN